jgi:hypothetical protein
MADQPILDRLAELRILGLAFFDDPLQWKAKSPTLTDAADTLSKEYSRVARLAMPAVRRSPLLTEVDAVQLGRAFRSL